MPQQVEQLHAANGSSGPAPQVLSDEQVIQRVLEGDAAAFELIVRRYNQRLFRVARSIVGEDAQAEDVVQEAYVRAYEHLRQFAGRARFSTWLTKIAVYEALSQRRARRRLRLAPAGEQEIDAMGPTTNHRDAADAASQQELGLLLASAVDALPTELRLVFTLRMVEGLSTDDTAECLELTPSNVKVRLHRARSSLQSWIDDRIGEEARRLYAFAGERCDRIVRNVMGRILRD